MHTAEGAIAEYCSTTWGDDIVGPIADYIRIPALSPAFDPDWHAHGHIASAVRLLSEWARPRLAADATLDVVEIEGRTPVILIDIPASDGSTEPATDTVLLYGHLDKQPEMVGWREGLGPWSPVRDGDRLYGRGGADDGYALFASLCAIEAVRAAGATHARCVVLIEASEESGSPDLGAHMGLLAARIGTPSLVIGLDSGCGDYERLWVTTSLRGLVAGDLSVSTTTHGLHSGGYGGVIPSTFRIARQLLDRIEDPVTGELHLDEARRPIPDERVSQAERTAAVLVDFADELPLLDGVDAVGSRSVADLLLDKAWRPALEVIGADGLPSSAAAGNVLRPNTTLAVSVRIAPTADPAVAGAELKSKLEANPPYGAHVSMSLREGGGGWEAPATAPWLAAAIDEASLRHFGNESAFLGEGGSIPFMGMLGKQFPDAQFLITGVLGPESNAHGPNEFLHIPMATALTACVAEILVHHGER